jgi:hypothetical protein
VITLTSGGTSWAAVATYTGKQKVRLKYSTGIYLFETVMRSVPDPLVRGMDPDPSIIKQK